MGLPGAVRREAFLALGLTVAASWASPATAEERPTEGGLWSFDDTDELQAWDTPDGTVRVHFSVQGPNVTIVTDADDDGVPDYVQRVGSIAVDALQSYRDQLGVREPLSELEVGAALGGNAALDIYLIDFGGAADGRFGIDGCTAEGRCAGFVVVENDFSGYGYPTTAVAIAIVVSHELFHAVQAAYSPLPVWISEGTATWATYRYDPDLPDFLRACGGYLADPGRPIYQPPLGPVPAFAYGTALWWDFITRRNGDAFVDALFTALDDATGKATGEESPQRVMANTLATWGDPLSSAWPVFVQYNLANGFRSGGATSHPYAAELPPVDADVAGSVIDQDARLYPLAAEYWRIEHSGGALTVGADAELSDTVVSLHPVADFAADGVVGDPIAVVTLDRVGSTVFLEDVPSGGYWITASHATVADGPAKARICVGNAAHVLDCGIEPADDEPDSDSDSDSGTTADGVEDGDSDDGQDDTAGTDTHDTDTHGTSGGQDTDPAGCSCQSNDGSPPPATYCLVVVVLGVSRRRGWA